MSKLMAEPTSMKLKRAQLTIKGLRTRVRELEGLVAAADRDHAQVRMTLCNALGLEPMAVNLWSLPDLARRVVTEHVPKAEFDSLRNKLRNGFEEQHAGDAWRSKLLEVCKACGMRGDENISDFVRRVHRERVYAGETGVARLRKCLGEDLDRYGTVEAVERLTDAWSAADTERRALADRLREVRDALAPPEQCADADLAAYARAVRETMGTAIRREAEARRPSLGEALLLVAAEIGRGTLGPEAALTVRAPGKGDACGC